MKVKISRSGTMQECEAERQKLKLENERLKKSLKKTLDVIELLHESKLLKQQAL